MYLGNNIGNTILHTVPSIEVNSDTTIDKTLAGFQVLCNTSLSDIVVTLPSVNDVGVGFTIYIQKIITINNVTIESTDLIDGVDQLILQEENSGIGITNNGITWNAFSVSGISTSLATPTEKGFVRLATKPQTNALTLNNVVITPSSIADIINGITSGSNFSTNGYHALGNGLILQWGQINVPRGQTTVNFPITFPNKPLQGYVVRMYQFPNSTGYSIATESNSGMVNLNKTSAGIFNGGIGGLMRWIVLGC